jgi:uncharacterized protein
MTEEIEQVTRLQSLDMRIAELEREIATLPKHIAQIEKALDSHLRRLEADRAALAGNQKERKSLEDDSKVENQKISKLKDQMLGAKTNEVYRAFQNEIEFCQKEIRRFEDRILELMGEAEPLDKNVKAAETALKAEKAEVDAEKVQARERTTVDEKAAAELRLERASIVKDVTPPVYQLYERVRKGRKGIAVAEAVEGRCAACNITLRLQFFQDLKKGDELLRCENCQRILYYNPPVSFEDLAGEAAPAVRE